MPSQEKHLSEEPPKFYNPNDDDIADRLFSTNNVLIEKIPSDSKDHPKQVIVYLPAYMRAKAKNINEVELTNLTSSINLDLIYDIYFGDLFESDERFKKKSPKSSEDGQKMTYEQELRQMFQNDFKLNFSRGDPVLLAQVVNKEQNLQIKVKTQKSNQIGFTVRKVFSMHMDGNIWLSPFQLLNSILQITVHPLTFNLQSTKYSIRINLMNHPDCDVKLSFPENEIDFGKYQLAKNLTRTAYTNQKMEKPKEFDMSYEEHQAFLQNRHAKKAGKSLEQYRAQTHSEKDIKYFQYAYFNLPVYKHPFDTIITSIVPIWLLGIINLGIFFQDQNLNDRLGSIIALVIALITYIPTIEETTPPTPNLVMAKLMVYLEIAAVICTFIHSMRVKFETNFRLQWKETPEYWIAFWLLLLSAIIVIFLTIVHYAYWKRMYNDPMYSEGRRQNRKFRKREKAKKMLYQMQPIPETQAPEPLEVIKVRGVKAFKFKKQKWANLECDVYFNRFFVGERERVQKQKNSKDERKYADYFVIKQRKITLTAKQVHLYYVQKRSELQTQASKSSHSMSKKKSIEQKCVNHPNHITNSPLVYFNQAKQLNLYLPGYMRLKFKNFNSLDFDNLGGDLNATMIFTIYYGEVFEYLKKEIDLRPQDQEMIMSKMKNDFLLMFEKDNALQLTEGKMEKKVEVKYNDQKITPTRNIDLTIKEDPNKKCLHFTIRRVFQTHMDSYIFLTPIQKLKTSIDVNINSIKLPLKTRKLNTSLTISINLMDTPNKIRQDFNKLSQEILSVWPNLAELNIGYYNDKFEADKEFKMLWDKESFWGKRQVNRREQKRYKRIFEDIDKVFTKHEYTSMRNAYREMGERDKRIKEYFIKSQFSETQTAEQIQYLQIHKQKSERKFGEKSSYQPYKYASIRIPLYKFPFDSIAIIFFPLWLLAILNLGIFFQTEQFAERVISIAALLIAFVSLIPTIRDRIPPSPSITLVEFLVAALLFTCFLTLGHSMSVRFMNGFQFTEWGQSGWFLSALVITLLTVAIVCILLIYHYTMLEPNYRTKLPKQNKFNRKMWSNQKCQQYTIQRYSFQEAYRDPQNSQNVVYKIFNYKGSQYLIKQQKDSRSDNTIEPNKQEEGFFQRLWRYFFGGDEGRNMDSQDRRGKGPGSLGTLREFKDAEI